MKVLIIRFSSIGDIIQCMSVTQGIKRAHPNAEIHWVTRKDMAPMLKTDPDIYKIWEFNRKEGLIGLFKLALKIKKIKPDFIYDAHLNIRSYVTKMVLSPIPLRWMGFRPKCVIRYKDRLNRILYFNFKKRNALKLPFRGMLSFQVPLIKNGMYLADNSAKKYTFSEEVVKKVESIYYEKELNNDKVITLVPSAAWELKRWPVKYWKDLVRLMPNYKFVILAGPGDTFTEDIEDVDNRRVVNLAGKTSLLESFYAVWKSNVVVSADTGILHAADLFKKKAIALMGPTAFGHPTGATVKVLEVDLPCRPCTKEGNADCKIHENKKCLVDIKPTEVYSVLKKMID